MVKNMIMAGAILGVAFGVTGCMTHPVTFVGESRPVEPGQYTVIGDETEGLDYQVQTFGLGLSIPGSAQRRAYQQALRNAPGADGLIEMAVDVQRIDIPFVSFVTTRVTGTPIKANK